MVDRWNPCQPSGLPTIISGRCVKRYNPFVKMVNINRWQQIAAKHNQYCPDEKLLGVLTLLEQWAKLQAYEENKQVKETAL